MWDKVAQQPCEYISSACGSTLYMCLFYMLRRHQTDHCASFTPQLWELVTNSVVPTPSSTQTTTSSGVMDDSSRGSGQVFTASGDIQNNSTSMSSTLARTTTTMRSSPYTSQITIRPSASSSPTTRPSASTSPTPPPTTERLPPILAPHRRKKKMRFPVIIGIVVAVVVFFVAVGALIARKKRSMTRLG